jgi:hypothetical protein
LAWQQCDPAAPLVWSVDHGRSDITALMTRAIGRKVWEKIASNPDLSKFGCTLKIGRPFARVSGGLFCPLIRGRHVVGIDFGTRSYPALSSDLRSSRPSPLVGPICIEHGDLRRKAGPRRRYPDLTEAYRSTYFVYQNFEWARLASTTAGASGIS